MCKKLNTSVFNKKLIYKAEFMHPIYEDVSVKKIRVVGVGVGHSGSQVMWDTCLPHQSAGVGGPAPLIPSFRLTHIQGGTR